MDKNKIALVSYRGYHGAFSFLQGKYAGRIYGIKDLVTFEGDHPSVMQKEFENAVDDYCLTCEEQGKPW